MFFTFCQSSCEVKIVGSCEVKIAGSCEVKIVVTVQPDVSCEVFCAVFAQNPSEFIRFGVASAKSHALCDLCAYS